MCYSCGHDEHESVGASVDSRPLYSWCLTVVDMMNTSQWERQLTAVLSTLGVLQLWDMMNTSQWERQLTAVLSTLGVLQLWT